MACMNSTHGDDGPRHVIVADLYNLRLAVKGDEGTRQSGPLSSRERWMLEEFLERANPALAGKVREAGWSRSDSALRFLTQEGGMVQKIVDAYLGGAVSVLLMDHFLQDWLGPRFLSIHRIPHVKGLRSALEGLGQLRERRKNPESEEESAPEGSGGDWVQEVPRWPIRNPIERVMEEGGWSLRRLAEMIGVEYGYLGNLRSGRKNQLGSNTATRLAKALLTKGGTPVWETEVSWAAIGMQEEYYLSRQCLELEWLTVCDPNMDYGLPEIAVICYDTWLALVDLIYNRFTLRRCALEQCGRVFMPTPRASSHHHYCSTKCRSRQRYMSSPYRRGRQDR